LIFITITVLIKFIVMEKSKIKIPSPFEPKRKNRWVVRMEDGANIKEWVVFKSGRPKYIKKRKWYGSSYYEIEPMEISFRDPITPSTSKPLYNLYLEDKSVDFTLEILDPTGVSVEKWEILGCEILEVDFGELCYESNELLNCTIKLKPKSAILIN
jgi:hypothetical protein